MMRWFSVPQFSQDMLASADREWLYQLGNNIVEPFWSIRPCVLTQDELYHIAPILHAISTQPAYVAVIMTPRFTNCKTHTDNIGGRVSAINIPINVEASSMFQYMSEDGDVMESIDLQPAKAWDVSVPHRVYNLDSKTNRVVLSLGFTETINELHEQIFPTIKP